LNLSKKHNVFKGDKGLSEEEIIIKEYELNFLKSLDVVSFYQHLINIENYTLVQMFDETTKTKNEYEVNIDKTQNSKQSYPDTIYNRVMDRLTRMSGNVDLTLGLISKSMVEWKNLIPDDQVIYIIGRYEIEGQNEFDIKGFEEYKENIYKSNQIKNNLKIDENEKQ